MNAPRSHPSDEQLTLPFPTTDPTGRLGASAEALISLNAALRFLLDVVDGHAMPGQNATSRLQESLDVLATFNLGGRLGFVVRQFRTQPPSPTSWTELVEELGFAISLYEGEPTP